MNKINSIKNPYIKNILKLKDKKNILKEKRFLIEGKNILFEALKANIIETILITKEEYLPQFKGERVLVSEDIIKKISTNNSNKGIVGVCRIEDFPFVKNAFKKIIVLDEINNPNNLGAIVRSALAFDYEAIFLLNESVFQYNSKVISSSQGALFKLPIIKIERLEELQDYQLFFLVPDAKATELSKIKIKQEKFGFVLGNEANGIKKAILELHKDALCYIPISKKIDSLNIAIAAAIAMEKY